MRPSFRTEIVLSNYAINIKYGDFIMAMGSCFAQHVERRLKRSKFNVHFDPSGIVYNPLSIANSLDRIATQNPYNQEELIFHNDLWHSFDHHGNYSGPDRDTVHNANTNRLTKAGTILKSAKVCFLTFGTAHVYKSIHSGHVVANCHKLPAKQFKRYRVSEHEIIKSVSNALQKIWVVNPNIQIVVTVSPVRHLKDGMIENTRSKASLIMACAALEKTFPAVHYFPVYEMFMDDLRDYRYYADDLLHPSTTGIEYVWHKFAQTFFNEPTSKQLQRVEKLIQMIEHRPLHPKSEKHRQFRINLLDQLMKYQSTHPEIDFHDEIETIKIKSGS